MVKDKNVNIGTCVNCNELNFPSRKCLKSVLTEPIELKEALMPRNCNYFSSVSFIENKWNWKNGLILGGQRTLFGTAIMTLILIIPLILANFSNIIVIREILVLIPLFLFTMLTISHRQRMRSIKKRQTLSKWVVWYETFMRSIGLMIVIVSILNIYKILDNKNLPSLIFTLLLFFFILNYFSNYPVPLYKYFPEINKEFYDNIQFTMKKDPWKIFIPLNNYKDDKPHPLFLGIALNSLENLHEEISLPIIRSIVQNYWEEIFPGVIRNLFEDGNKKSSVGAVLLLAQKIEEPEVIDFIIDMPTMTIPIKKLNAYIEGLLGTGKVDLRILIKRLGVKAIVSEEMWGMLLAAKQLESKNILNEEIKKSEGTKKKRYEKLLEYLEKSDKKISEKGSGKPNISSAKAEFEIALKDMQREDCQSAINRLNAIVSKYPSSSEVKLLAYSLLSRCYIHLEKHKEAYSFSKPLFSSSSYKPKFEDYAIKLMCEMNLKLSTEAKATLKEARDKFPNHPKLKDPSLQILGEMLSTIPDSRESSALEFPIPGTTIKSVPSDEIFQRVQQKFRSMLTDDREKNLELVEYFFSISTMMDVTVGSENEEHKPVGTMIVREGKILHVSDETILNLTKATGSLVVFSAFEDAYNQINVAFQDERYVPAAEDYLVKIICEIELLKYDEALKTLGEINRLVHIRENEKIKEFGLDLFSIYSG